MRLTLVRLVGVTLLALHATACAPPERGAAARGATLAVGMAGPVSVAWLGDGHGPHGVALAGPPEQLAAGPRGSVVALTAGAAGGGRVQLEVARPGGAAASGPAGARLEGVETSGAVRLAGDGQRYAVMAYQPRWEAPVPTGFAGFPAGDPRCPLLVVDLRAGASVPAHAPCRAEERVRSLTLEPAGGSAGDIPRQAAHVYVGLEDTRHGGEHRGRLVVLALPSGAVVDVLDLAGAPVDLRLAPASEAAPAALYVLEQAGGASGLVPTPEGGRVLVLDPLTLDVRREHALGAHASRLVPAPDNWSAFLVRDDTVRRLDLATGQARHIARLPGRIVAAEVFGERLYLASPEARVLWALDARTGYRQPDLRVPGSPLSLAASVHGAG